MRRIFLAIIASWVSCDPIRGEKGFIGEVHDGEAAIAVPYLPPGEMYINATVACVVPTDQPSTEHIRRFFASEGLSAGARLTDEIGVFVSKHDPIVNITRAETWKPGSSLHEHLALFGPVQNQLIYVAHYLTYVRALEWYIRQNPAPDACLLMLEDDVVRSGLDSRELSEIVRDAPDFTALFLEWCYGNQQDAVQVAPKLAKGLAASCTAAVVWSPRGIREFLAFSYAHGPSVIDVLTERYAQTDGKNSCLYVVPAVMKQTSYDKTTNTARIEAAATSSTWHAPRSELRPAQLLHAPSERSNDGVIEVDGEYRYVGTSNVADKARAQHADDEKGPLHKEALGADLFRDPDVRPPCFTLPEHFKPGAWRGSWALDRRSTETFFAPECPFYGDLFAHLASADPSGQSLTHHADNPDQDEHRLKFQSNSCNASSYSSRELRSLLANRTVVFLGDSVSLGMASNLACALWKATAGEHVSRHIRATRDGMEAPAEPSRCFKFLEDQVVCWISAATCASFGYDEPTSLRRSFCAETYLRSLGHAITSAADFLRPSDVVVANAGMHFKIDNAQDRALLLAELEGLCANIGLWGETAPLVVWRENAAHNWEQGRFPYSPHTSGTDSECEALPDGWLEGADPWDSEYNPYNLFLEPLLEECAGVRRLPVWFPSAMLGLADRVGRRGDCTHYFGPGSAHGLWNTMLLDILRNHDTRMPGQTAAPERISESAHQSERWRGIVSLVEGTVAD
jgi:hypothetical protein